MKEIELSTIEEYLKLIKQTKEENIRSGNFKEFVFRGLIKCAVTGKTVSSDRKEDKTNKNMYLIYYNGREY